MQVALEDTVQSLVVAWNASKDGIAIFSGSEPATLTSANRQFIELFLLGDLEEYIGKSDAEMAELASIRLIPEERQMFCEYLSLPHDEVSSKVEREFTLEGEEPRMLSIYVTPLIEKGQCTGSVWFIRDITLRRELEKQLQKNSEKYRTLVESVGEIVYSFDPEGNFTFLNQAVTELLGYKPEELLGKPFWTLFEREDAQRQKVSFEQYRLDPPCTSGDAMDIEVIEATMMTKSGQPRRFKIKDTGLFENGQFIGNQGVAIDLTAEKDYSSELEVQVGERTSELEYANEQLSALSRISHELREVGSEDELYDLLPRKLCEALDFDRANLMLLENGLPVTRAVYWPKDEHLVERFKRGMREYHDKLASGEMDFPPVLRKCFVNV